MALSLVRWLGKVAIVTGASSGIGAAIATTLVKNGLNVVGVARRSELVEEKAKTLANQKGKLHAFKADLSKEEDILELFKWTKNNLGPVHVLVNNAAVSLKSSLTDGKREDWQKLFDLNVLGLCSATREAVKVMKENDINGHIIHINSVAGHTVPAIPFSNVYPAGKFAVTGLTETLRQELNELKLKIKITSLSPGFVESEMTILRKHLGPKGKAFYADIPFLKPEDIADGVVYALSTPEHVQVHELTIKPIGEKC